MGYPRVPLLVSSPLCEQCLAGIKEWCYRWSVQNRTGSFKACSFGCDRHVRSLDKGRAGLPVNQRIWRSILGLVAQVCFSVLWSGGQSVAQVLNVLLGSLECLTEWCGAVWFTGDLSSHGLTPPATGENKAAEVLQYLELFFGFLIWHNSSVLLDKSVGITHRQVGISVFPMNCFTFVNECIALE